LEIVGVVRMRLWKRGRERDRESRWTF